VHKLSEQPLVSVTSTQYWVVTDGVAVGFGQFVQLNPVAGIHRYVPPPVAAILALSPTSIVVSLVIVALGPELPVIVVVCVFEQPLASVTVQLYVPAVKFAAVVFVPPEGLQLYVYGPVPPLAVTEALPGFPHIAFTAVMVDLISVG